MRKSYTAEIKAKVALEAIKGQRTVSEIAGDLPIDQVTTAFDSQGSGADAELAAQGGIRVAQRAEHALGGREHARALQPVVGPQRGRRPGVHGEPGLALEHDVVGVRQQDRAGAVGDEPDAPPDDREDEPRVAATGHD